MPMISKVQPLELWGGVECSVIRIRDEFRNQTVETGHAERISDLELIARLGVKTLRYPVVWETIAPNHPDVCDWRWSDERFARLSQLGIEPIAGLLHHGSGPAYTSLADEHFADLLAVHAGRVAARYPHVNMFTPVNEPLTTARFSGLYGHWYPHARDNGAFLRILVNECRATVLAMRAIRKENPQARLVQTEDLGRVFSTSRLQHQAEYENERRWLSLDLLFGRVDKSHPWRKRLQAQGITDKQLDFFLDGDGAPDIVGINHYPTSDRFLDERAELYPACFHGGNATERYADVEALRVDLPAEELGPKARLSEAWQRYGRTIVVTEAHHGSTRDEQVRWLKEIWQGALELREAGQDIRAVTIWSLFGAVDWNSLVTARNGFYEPGAFDVRAPSPRLTAIGRTAMSLATGSRLEHPAFDAQGWWRREGRHYHPPARKAAATPKSSRPLLITGATGTLGRAFSRICQLRGLEHVTLTRHEMDIADPISVQRALSNHRPWAVVNAAGYVRVKDAAQERDTCFRGNAQGSGVLARACAAHGLQLAAFSSDRVFDGSLGRPYVETDHTRPRCVYGESKAQAEQRIRDAHPDALQVRTSAFFGPWDCANFVWRALAAAYAGHALEVDREIISPTYVPDLVNTTLDLLIDGERGVWHVTNSGMTSWAELAARVTRDAGLTDGPPTHAPVAPEPICALTSERGVALPSYEEALGRYLRECEVDWRQARYRMAAE